MENFGIIILAAGKATRMGKPKALLPYQEETLLLSTFKLALACNPASVVVVIGHYFNEMSNYCSEKKIPFAFNKKYDEGMGSSIQCGLDSLLLKNPHLSSILILLADQPSIKLNHLIHLFEKLNQFNSQLICTAYGSTLGVPAIFKNVFFKNLLSLNGEKGAKELILKYATKNEHFVTFEDAIFDIDTPDDYAQLLKIEPAKNKF